RQMRSPTRSGGSRIATGCLPQHAVIEQLHYERPAMQSASQPAARPRPSLPFPPLPPTAFRILSLRERLLAAGLVGRGLTSRFAGLRLETGAARSGRCDPDAAFQFAAAGDGFGIGGGL